MDIFNKIQLKNPAYSRFDLSYDHKLSLKMGKLVPIHVQETVPGDKFNISAEGLFRMMPMIAPIMHKVDVFIHYFFVPNRILWDSWEDFITGGQDGTALPPAFPVLDPLTLGQVTPSTLPDYMGLPLGYYNANPAENLVSAMPFAAYQRIYYEWYRDQNLQDPEMTDYPELEDGIQANTADLLVLRDRAWEHDYFTSALPFAQKGDPVDIPISIDYSDLDILAKKGDTTFRNSSNDSIAFNGDVVIDGAGNTEGFGAPGNPNIYYDPKGTLYLDGPTDLTGNTTIEDLRVAQTLQSWLERNAVAGTRYKESILAHFNVRSSDQRLQRPEYLGGSRSAMAISEVLQTSESSDTAQGNMAGHGISVNGGNSFSYSCEEHGYIIGILSIRPRTAYQQGLHRHFTKFDRLDYAWPSFAMLGEQAIKNKELYMDLPIAPAPTQNEGTFGYIPRYSEYRYNSSRVSGEMRSTLNFWHMGRIFGSLPTLSGQFIASNPTTRIFAVTDPAYDTIVAHIYQKIYATRPLPKYGTPAHL